MNDYDLKSFNILVSGTGSEYFHDILKTEKSSFDNEGLYLNISEGFSAPEITQVMISIGSNVIAGLSVYYIAKIFDKIFSAKEKAKKEGKILQINVNISERVLIKDAQSTIEIEKSINIEIKSEKVEND